MKLFLVRHGETKENEERILMGHHHGILTEKGKEQAKATALSLKGYKLDQIYSSDLNRCVDTAEFIKEYHPDTPVTFTHELRERNLGNLQGKKSASVDWDGLPGDGDHKKPENGESIAELKIRALDFVKRLYEQHPNDSILLVSHNGWIKQILSHFTGVHSKDIHTIENAQIVEIEIGKNMTGRILNQNKL